MFDHVMVALDLSPAADLMLRCLPGLRELGTRRLTLVHVAEVDYPVFGAVAHLDQHRERLDGLVPAIRAAGFEVQVVATAGNPASEILKTAGERGASLVLLGSRSHSRVREAFIGSVAWDVLRRSSVPVLLQRLDPETDRPDSRLVASCCDLRSHVLFPTDFSETAERAFTLVDTLARLGARSFTLLHVREEREAEAEPSSDRGARERLEDLAVRLRAAGADDVHIDLVRGQVVTEVLRQAQAQRDTLIVMGTHGRGLIAEAVLGSVSREVLRRTRGSVLLYPARA
jgi:nucleotide-binding universal stress UspA family protein